MSQVKLDEQLFERLTEIASGVKPLNTTGLLPEEQKRTTYLFLCSLACRSQEEYESVKEGLGEGQPFSADFDARLALVTRAFCIGHEWVANNWCLWSSPSPLASDGRD